ncbi:sugar ABC transporter substrate-binding protein [Listeria costaricensis]|uniref:sugar ABC transporter substrate-binding protein n=1 Tax=Listeria costaricensis TaxID=2026604 RepID=UPI000C0748DF|nr:sugar ABC transporter substrate-binding protein [Listeria costaricensis]
MKKRFSLTVLAAAALMSVLFLSACGGDSSNDSSSSKNELVFWAMGDEASTTKELVKGFTKETGIKVKVQAIPWSNAHDKMLTAIASKSGPDVVQVGTTNMAEFVEAGALADITKKIDSTDNLDPSKFYPAAIETTQFNDKTYGVPWYVETRVLFYRTDVLEAAGYSEPPKTWEELHDVAVTLSKRGDDLYGFSIDPNEGTFGYMFGRQNGSELINEKGEPVLDQKEFVDAIKYLDSFIKDGATPKQDLGMDITQTFGGDQPILPMFISGPWMANTLETTAPELDGKWAIATLPKKENNLSALGGSDLAVFEYSDKKDDALKLIDYLSRPDVQMDYLKSTKNLPSSIEAWEDPSIKNDTNYQIFKEQLESSKPMPLVPQYEEMAEAYKKYWEQIAVNGEDVDQAMKDLNAEVAKMLQN